VARAIESLIGVYPRLEIIVIDDGSAEEHSMVECARPYGRNTTTFSRWPGLNAAVSRRR
jgi:glycosyltransferase involved in cell wall biosynthesis